MKNIPQPYLPPSRAECSCGDARRAAGLLFGIALGYFSFIYSLHFTPFRCIYHILFLYGLCLLIFSVPTAILRYLKILYAASSLSMCSQATSSGRTATTARLTTALFTSAIFLRVKKLMTDDLYQNLNMRTARSASLTGAGVSALLAFFSSAGMSICCGQWRAHFPHPVHEPASGMSF